MPPEKTDDEKTAEAKAAEAKEAEEAKAKEVAEKAEADKPLGADGKPFDPERAQRAIGAAREAERKAKSEAKELREAKAELDKLKEKDLSESDRLKKKVEELEGKVTTADGELKEARLLREIARSKTKTVDPDAALTFLKGRVEYEDGKPQGVEDALKALLEEKPYLKGKPSAPSVDGGSGGEEAKTSLTAEQAQMAQMFGMKPEEYAAWTNKTDIPPVSQTKE